MRQFFAIALLSLLSTITNAQETKNIDAAGAKLVFINMDTTYDFGDVPSLSMVQYKFEFKNTGKDDLIITDAHCTLPYIKIQWPNKPVKHGKKGIVTVSATPLEIGSFKDDVFITSNATPSPYPFLHLSGAVIPEGDPGTQGTSSAPKGGKRGGR